MLRSRGLDRAPVVIVHKGVTVEIPRLSATREMIEMVVARIDRGEQPIQRAGSSGRSR